jgi:hypothetical protein
MAVSEKPWSGVRVLGISTGPDKVVYQVHRFVWIARVGGQYLHMAVIGLQL